MSALRIAVLRTQVPFVTGGAERHAANLVAALEEAGHEAVEVTLPFRWYPALQVVDHALAAQLTDLERFEGAPVDLAIGLKFPAWLARHPNKIFWILHQHRQAYDQWEAGSSDLLADPDGPAVRAFVREADKAALGPAAAAGRVFANSANVAARLERGLGLRAEPLYHPPPNAERLRAGAYGPRLLAPGRINPAKRQKLMIEALAQTAGPVRLAFLGPADSAAYLAELKALAERLGVAGRIDWLGAVDDRALVAAYAEARAVVYTPVDEDYGYVTLEAMIAARPLIVTSDSGGPLEFVTDGAEGLVVAPEPAALAAAFDRLAEDAALAERLGSAGAAAYAARGIGWPAVVARLLAAAEGRANLPTPAPAGPPAPAILQPAPAAELVGPAIEAVTAPPGRIGAPEGDAGPAPDREQRATPAVAIGAEGWGPPPAPMPAAAPYPSLEALLAAWDFGETAPGGHPDAAAAAYFATHWRRFLATLALVEADPPPAGAPFRVLDLGQFPPFLFQALLSTRFPGAVHAGVWDVPETLRQTVHPRSPDGPEPFAMHLAHAEVERDPLPFPEASQDLVLAMEILEHLAVDPLHCLAEALRVLAPGGRLVLTTPNIASHGSLARQLAGENPMTFAAFVPGGGVHGRHNREWTPVEVARLAEAAGFETDALATADLYGEAVAPEVAALLAGRGDDGRLHGGTVLYTARKPAAPDSLAAGGLPEGLYHGDPRALGGRLEVRPADTRDGRRRIAITNTSRRPWLPLTPGRAGETGATVLYADWRDGTGTLVHGGALLGIGAMLAPGETREIALALGTPEDAPEGTKAGSMGTLVLDLLQTGAGRFSLAGRAQRLALPCSEAAYLRLAAAHPRA